MNTLNRNVHPLYAVMAFIAAGIVLILYLYSVARHHDEKRPHLPLFIFTLFKTGRSALHTMNFHWKTRRSFWLKTMR